MHLCNDLGSWGYPAASEKADCINICIACKDKDFEKAVGILETIESEVCVSLWSCGQKLMIKEQTLGLEGNKSELSNMFDSIEGSPQFLHKI